MRIYKVFWSGAVCLLAVAGVVLALSSLQWGSLVGLGVVGVVLGPLFGAGLHWQTRGTATPLRHLLAAAVLAVVGVVTFAGLLVFLDAVALLVVGLVVLSSPWVVRVLTCRAPRSVISAHPEPPAQRAPRIPPQAGPPPPLRCDALDDAELCWRWRTTFTALQRVSTSAERLRLIETRAALLDEIARRNPAGFSRWLHDGARAASDPGRYFPQPKPPPAG